MFKIATRMAAVAALFVCLVAGASQKTFCEGFAEGYRSVKGDMVLLPMCPMEPMTPLGSTPYREGLKAGIRAAGR